MQDKGMLLDYSEVYDNITSFIANFAKNITSDTKFVIGISGGIDSALCAALAVRSVGSSAVRGIYMPSSANSEDSERLSYELCENLGIKLDVVDIGGMQNAFRENFELSTEVALGATALGNISARLRMITVMAMSNELGGVVVNTGNLTEKILGYYTLYGDGAGAIAPIASLLKTDVWNLSRFINENLIAPSEPELIPHEIIDRVPSAELIAGQTDEGDIGESYAEMDKCIVEYFNADFNESLIASNYLAKSIYGRYVSNKFKISSNIKYPTVRMEQELFLEKF